MFDLFSLDLIPKENMLAAAAAKSHGAENGREDFAPIESEPTRGDEAECEEEEEPVEDDPAQDVD